MHPIKKWIPNIVKVARVFTKKKFNAIRWFLSKNSQNYQRNRSHSMKLAIASEKTLKTILNATGEPILINFQC